MRYFRIMENTDEGIRINKYFTVVGFCSRRAADKLIDEGAVKINGVVPEKGTKVMPGDEVTVHGKKVAEPEKKECVYIALHKPVGIVCTTDTRREKDNIVDFINFPTRIFPVGRLDKMSGTGTKRSTSSPSIVHLMMHLSKPCPVGCRFWTPPHVLAKWRGYRLQHFASFSFKGLTDKFVACARL